MANFKYNPPTRDFCPVCLEIAEQFGVPLIDVYAGKASSAENSPIHNWFYFVLGYSPAFPEYIFEKEGINESHVVADPFMGTGTTLVAARRKSINNLGIDANDFFIGVATTKTNDDIDKPLLKKDIDLFISTLEREFIKHYSHQSDGLFSDSQNLVSLGEYAAKHRPPMLESKYICDLPFAKLHIAKTLLENIELGSEDSKRIISLAINSLIVPSSNVRYGPGFGISTKLKEDIDLIKILTKKLKRMHNDLKEVGVSKSSSSIFHGDAREMNKYFGEEEIDFLITSPPYPGDHEYTKHTRLELIFNDIASTKDEFKTIKKRMLRGSTTNLYKEDNDKQLIHDFTDIQDIVSLVAERLQTDLDNSDRKQLSGFEKLYTKLIWEYFGGMARVFDAALKSLKPGGKFILLVSDSHAFKMVHIRTAYLLGEIAKKQGFSDVKIELWQNKVSTSHKYNIPEEILTLTK